MGIALKISPLGESQSWYRLGSRFYDPFTSTWISRDPALQFASPYVYCGGNGLTCVDPNGEAGYLTIASSRGNNYASYGVIGPFGNHSLIVFEPDKGRRPVTYGTWGNTKPAGLKINFRGDINYATNPKLTPKDMPSRRVWISDEQEAKLNTFIDNTMAEGEDAWTKLSPCSDFASDLWFNVVGEDLEDRGLFISDPNILATSIENIKQEFPMSQSAMMYRSSQEVRLRRDAQH